MSSRKSLVFKPRLKEKRWDPSVEPIIFQKWQKDGIYEFKKDSKRPVFSIDTPPPYVNTPVHIGQAYTYVWMDIFARYKRMTGYNVLFPIGLDKNGLPVEVQAEKTFGISVRDTPREEFIEKCKQILKESGDQSIETFKRLGLSCNSWRLEHKIGGRYETDDPEYRRLTQETFIMLWRKGLIYEDEKTTNYCPVCGTTISDAEVEYEEEETDLNYIRFRVKETGEEIIIATTRPELLCSCRLVIFNPEDERYTHLDGKHAIVPIYGHEVPIMPHPYAKPEFGSGLVMICSFGDYSDIRILRELNIKPIYAIDEMGRMNKNAGKYEGLTVEEARRQIIEDLKAEGLIVKVERIKQRRPVCWRSKNPIEFVPMKEYYLKQVEFKDEILKMTDEMRFFAPESKQILIDWINSVGIDWVISRRRFYGTEIPLWYCEECGYIYVPEPGRYYQPWKEKCPIEKCPKCGSSRFRGEERTFDTWFDSATSEVYILGYLWDKEFFKENFPCSLRPQGKEIVRNWLYFTMLKSYLLFGKAPFRNVWIHMHVVDEEGRKISKSRPETWIDPQEVIDRLGAEAFRIWSGLEGNITRGDIRCSFERIEGTSKFLTKLWNIARFISSFPQEYGDYDLAALDRMILAHLNDLIDKCRRGYEEMNVFAAATAIRNFTWNIFADHYIEAVKSRAYNSSGDFDEKLQRGAWYTLHTVLMTLLKLLAPITPFITEKIWLEIYSDESIHIQSFPERRAEWESEMGMLLQKFIEFNNAVWRYKKSKGVPLSQRMPVKRVYASPELKPLGDDLKAMHRIDELRFETPKNTEGLVRLSDEVFAEE
ncbi:valine--tRNA ligase [Candidatus Bathyarchaeota archaeon]|nr:valine--tRNA ligase [Candidatus Bathyarchaeota archaeon]